MSASFPLQQSWAFLFATMISKCLLSSSAKLSFSLSQINRSCGSLLVLLQWVKAGPGCWEKLCGNRGGKAGPQGFPILQLSLISFHFPCWWCDLSRYLGVTVSLSPLAPGGRADPPHSCALVPLSVQRDLLCL